jgi:DNA-binding PadR family transcriptional regulator
MEKEGSVRGRSVHSMQRRTRERLISEITEEGTAEYRQMKLQVQRRNNKGENMEMRRYAGNELRKAREKKCTCHKNCDIVPPL